MRKSILAVVLGSVFSGVAMAGAGLSTALELGYRVDSLDWNIAGDTAGQNPNILSELEWSSLQIPQVTVDIDAWLADIYLRGSISYGEVIEGDNQDSDYLLDNRNGEFSRSNNSAGGEVADASIGIGYRFDTTGKKQNNSYVMPMIGYSIHTQDLRMTDGVQTVESVLTPPLGPFSGLNSSYDAEWQGAWIGIVFGEESIVLDMVLELSLIYHVVDYEAVADWNLRTDFAHPKSYEHFADGHGLTFSINTRSPMGNSKRWFWAFGFDYGRWQTVKGRDITYFSDNTIGVTQLNEVNWESTALNLGLELRLR